MRQIIVQEFVSIDGVMQAPSDPREYERGGWQRQFVCPEQPDHVTQLMLQADALLLGRKTYESLAGAWPAMKGLRGMADRITAVVWTLPCTHPGRCGPTSIPASRRIRRLADRPGRWTPTTGISAG